MGGYAPERVGNLIGGAVELQVGDLASIVPDRHGVFTTRKLRRKTIHERTVTGRARDLGLQKQEWMQSRLYGVGHCQIRWKCHAAGRSRQYT